MAAAAVVLESIVVVGGAIRDTIGNWYRVPQVLKVLDTKLGNLRVEKQTLEAEIQRLGLTEDQGLENLFDNALSNLQMLQTKLEPKQGRRSPYGGRLSKLKWSFFSAELQELVNSATRIFDEVLESLKKQLDFKEVLQKRVLANLPSLECRPDVRRYIRLERTYEKVMVALRNCDGPSVVLLHGGPGTGKSSLATDVAVQFRQDIVNRSAPVKPQASNSSLVFDQVIFLEGGPHIQLQAKQNELLEKLGWSTSGDAIAGAESDFDITVIKMLSFLLRDRKLLVILDDIWNSGSDFLQSMIDIGGKNVKWLISSQLHDLCYNLNCEFISISMEDVVLDDARRILAVHIGLPKTVISEVKDFMDPIIDKVNGNLLALTCIAPTIDPTRYTQKREWLRLEKELSDLLDSLPESKFQSKAYGRSYWGAVQVGFDLLRMPEQNLIFLIYMCKGPSIREGIVEYLFKHTNDRYQSFSKARRELQGRGLIKVTSVDDGIEGEESLCSWSIHSLLKEFIRRKYFQGEAGRKLATLEVLSKRGIVFDSKVKYKQESIAMNAMVALYFEKEFAEELVIKHSTQMDVPFCMRQLASSRSNAIELVKLELRNRSEEAAAIPPSESKAALCSATQEARAVFRGHVIEPVAQLLIRSEDDEWTSALHSATQEVFLKYSGTGVIDQDGTSTLLGAVVSKGCMLTTLSRYHQIEPHSFFGQVVVKSLVQLLEMECICAVSGDPGGALSLCAQSLLKRIAYELRYQLRMDKCKIDDSDKLRLSKVVEHLRDGLANSFPYDLQVCSTEALADLVRQNKYISNNAVDAHGLLEGLVTAILDDGCKALQRASARAIGNLGYNSTYTQLKKIVSCSGIVEALVAGVKKEEDEILQSSCAQALSNLSSGLSCIGLEIVNCSGALEALANGLDEEKSERLAHWSAVCLGNLADKSDDAKWKIVNLSGAGSGALHYFVSNVARTRIHEESAFENSGLMYNSVKMLRMLAMGEISIRAKMKESCPGIFDTLTEAVRQLSCYGGSEKKQDRDSILREIMQVLMLLYPTRAKEMQLHSAYAYWGRGLGMLMLGYYEEAVEDFYMCEVRLSRLVDPPDELLSVMCCAKAKAGDLQDALADANLWVENSPGNSQRQVALQERGVIKRIMGNLHGALADLDESFNVDSNDFEVLKQRGFVKYLLHDEEGAQVDAHHALQVGKDYGTFRDYNSTSINTALGTDIVRYLDFEL